MVTTREARKARPPKGRRTPAGGAPRGLRKEAPVGAAVAPRRRRGYMPAMDPVACYAANARRAALALTALYDEALAPHGLKVTQFSLLHAVKRREAPNLTELAEATGLDRSTLGRNLRGLEALGLVALSPGDDLRDRVVALTAEGRARLRAAGEAWRARQAEVEAALGEEAARFTDLSRRVAELARRRLAVEVAP